MRFHEELQLLVDTYTALEGTRAKRVALQRRIKRGRDNPEGLTRLHEAQKEQENELRGRIYMIARWVVANKPSLAPKMAKSPETFVANPVGQQLVRRVGKRAQQMIRTIKKEHRKTLTLEPDVVKAIIDAARAANLDESAFIRKNLNNVNF